MSGNGNDRGDWRETTAATGDALDALTPEQLKAYGLK